MYVCKYTDHTDIGIRKLINLWSVSKWRFRTGKRTEKYTGTFLCLKEIHMPLPIMETRLTAKESGNAVQYNVVRL